LAPADRSVLQLPGSMYPTLTRNAGPAKARNCRQKAAEGGGSGTVLLRPSNEQGSVELVVDGGGVFAGPTSFGAVCDADSFIEALEC